jgi:uncharacterized protein (TIGR03083 family)
MTDQPPPAAPPSAVEQELLELLAGLTDAQWSTKANMDWTVKDVVAHLVGWEKEAAAVLPEQWEAKSPAWFLETSDYAAFNKNSVENYRHFSGARLLEEWRRWRGELSLQVERIGAENLRSRPDLFDWVFSADRLAADERGEVGHYVEHLRQIKRALGVGGDEASK